MRFKSAAIVGMALVLSLSAGAMDNHDKGKAKKEESQAELQKQAKITMDQAKKTALAKENGTIKGSELEKEKGRLIYSFDIDVKGKIHEVQVDALTGAFVDDHVETAKEESQEQKADAKQRKHHKK